MGRKKPTQQATAAPKPPPLDPTKQKEIEKEISVFTSRVCFSKIFVMIK
jgi:hypothetical protein